MNRSQIMSRIGAKDTKPEMRLRRALHAAGLRFRIHVRDLPGRPDVVFRPARLAVFVHGCFWHAHPGCGKANIPKSNRSFWIDKFAANRRRDASKRDALSSEGWTVIEIWECELSDDGLLTSCVEWIADAVLSARH